MRVVAIGDVGPLDDMVHIGDEAMFEACIEELRARGVSDIVAGSANPGDTSARYGVQAITVAPGEPSEDLVRAIRATDGVIITGGGNLSTLWPAHVRVRAAIGRLAHEFGKPLILTGQTIGPRLDEADSTQVAELLGSAALVGLRESRSAALCERLGIPTAILRHTADDASFLVTDPSEPSDYCLVTIANHVGEADREDVVQAIAELLDEVVIVAGLRIVFLAHFGSLVPGVVSGDSLMHERVAARMSAAAEVVPTTNSVAAARLARGASLVVCTRYHPAVFAVPAGVPTIGIPVDDYTDTKLSGALGNFGQSSILPVGRLLGGEGSALLLQVWAARTSIREAGLVRAALERETSALWWDDVVAALDGTQIRPGSAPSPVRSHAGPAGSRTGRR